MNLTELRRLEAGAHDESRTLLQQYEAHKEFDASVRDAAPVLLEIAERAKEYKAAKAHRNSFTWSMWQDPGTSPAYVDACAEEFEAQNALFAAVEKLEAP